LFVDKKILTPVQVDGPEMRYDLSEAGHAHFHCSGCGGIFDIPTDEITMPDSLKDFSVQEVQLHFKGLCPGCR
jgi:Fe2+ or Zn2+ uptake regulation protein